MTEKLTLLEAADIFGLETDGKNKIQIVCPFCGQGYHRNKKTMGLNFEKEVFHCFRCGSSGGPINFWAIMRGITDFKEAVRDYYQYLGEQQKNNPTYNKKIRKRISIKQVNSNLADLKTRNKTYRKFLDMLVLNPQHKEDLIKRGLDEEAIEKGLYKSFPKGNVIKIIDNMLNDGLVLEGVPGFFKKNNLWTVAGENCFSGYFIPIINGNGEIQAMQIRNDNKKEGFPRYIYFSSADKERGAGATTAVHLVQGKKNKIILTEGALKANIINHFTDWNVLAIPGVYCTTYLDTALKAVKAHGFEKIHIAFDMDWKMKAQVKNALEKIQEIITNHELDYSILEWDDKYKGLDDYLAAQMK